MGMSTTSPCCTSSRAFGVFKVGHPKGFRRPLRKSRTVRFRFLDVQDTDGYVLQAGDESSFRTSLTYMCSLPFSVFL